MNADKPRIQTGDSTMDLGRRFRPGLAVSGLSLLGICLSFSAVFAQSGPVLDPSLPAPRRLSAGTPGEASAGRRIPAGVPVEEPAPAPHEAIGPIGPMPPTPSSEEAAPMPREQTPPPPPLVLPSAARAALPPELQRLHQEIERLRQEREAMLLEEMDLKTDKEANAGKTEEIAQMRRRVMDLLFRAAQQNKKAAASETQAKPDPPRTSSSPSNPLPRTAADGSKPAPSAPSPFPLAAGEGGKKLSFPPAAGKGDGTEGGKKLAKQPDHASRVLTDAPVDPLSLAQALYLAGDHAAALEAYRQLEQGEQKPDERIAIQYMMACCLRKLGKLDEAAMLFREVASSGGSDILVENAQWYLRAMKARRELDAQLEELRQSRQSLMPRKP